MLYDAEKMAFMQKQRILEQAVLQMYVKEQAKKNNKTEAEIEKQIFSVQPVSENDAKAWYEENKNRLQGREFNMIKNEIISHLTREKQLKIQDELLEKIKKEEKFALLLPEPQAPVMDIKTQGFPSKGASSPKVTIVEFADYGCSHCKLAAANLKQLVDQFKDTVKLVYIDFPLNPQGLSVHIAHGAHCANEQNKFWEYHYEAFAEQSNMDKDLPLKLAKKLGLDEQKFNACLANDSIRQKILDARKQGDELGINGTPAIFINGQKVDSYEFSELASEITKLLKS